LFDGSELSIAFMSISEKFSIAVSSVFAG